jgi:hypothetical protein
MELSPAKENILLQSGELVAASFIRAGATIKSQSLQKLDYPDIAACALHRSRVRWRIPDEP